MPRTAKVVAFSTTPEMAEEIDRLAAEEGRTRSELLREAVRAYSATARGCGPAGATVAREASTAYAPAPTITAPSLPGLARVLAVRAQLAALSATAGVARLWIFGSAVREDFDPQQSDFDFLVEFRSDAPRKPWFGELTDLKDEFERVLGRSVDLGMAGALKNRYVRDAVDAEKVLVYEQP